MNNHKSQATTKIAPTYCDSKLVRETTIITVSGVYKRYLLVCLIIIGIGMFTMSYKEGILNAEIAGGILVVAGIIGIMHCFHLVKNAKVAAYVMEFAIAYRIVTFIVSFIIGPYEPPKVTNILVWSLLLFSAIINKKYVIEAQKIRKRNKEFRNANKHRA